MAEPKILGERVKYIKRLLQKPYHLFYYTDRGRAIFRIENRVGKFLFWEGPFLAAAVDSAMEYIRHEIEQGAIDVDKIMNVKEVSKKDEKKDKKDEKKEDKK